MLTAYQPAISFRVAREGTKRRRGRERSGWKVSCFATGLVLVSPFLMQEQLPLAQTSIREMAKALFNGSRRPFSTDTVPPLFSHHTLLVTFLNLFLPNIRQKGILAHTAHGLQRLHGPKGTGCGKLVSAGLLSSVVGFRAAQCAGLPDIVLVTNRLKTCKFCKRYALCCCSHGIDSVLLLSHSKMHIPPRLFYAPPCSTAGKNPQTCLLAQSHTMICIVWQNMLQISRHGFVK